MGKDRQSTTQYKNGLKHTTRCSSSLPTREVLIEWPRNSSPATHSWWSEAAGTSMPPTWAAQCRGPRGEVSWDCICLYPQACDPSSGNMPWRYTSNSIKMFENKPRKGAPHGVTSSKSSSRLHSWKKIYIYRKSMHGVLPTFCVKKKNNNTCECICVLVCAKETRREKQNTSGVPQGGGGRAGGKVGTILCLAPILDLNVSFGRN